MIQSSVCNNRIKRKIKTKKRLYNKARKTKKENDWRKFKMLQKNIQKMLKNSRWKYLNEISLGDNPKPFMDTQRSTNRTQR